MNSSPYGPAELRRATGHFLTGKVLSGALTFGILLLLVRVLPVDQYAGYVTAIAVCELAYALSGLGLPWVAARYLPECRLHAPKQVITSLVNWLLIRMTASLFAVAGLLLFYGDTLALRFGIVVSSLAVSAWAGLVVSEGFGRHLRESVLGALMQQGVARTSLIARQAVLLSLLGWMALDGNANLAHVLLAEVFASACATALALTGLYRYLAKLEERTEGNGWKVVAAHDRWRVARAMFAGHLLSLAHGPQVFVLLLQRVAGAEATAVFGFLRGLYEQLAKYLPATLLFALIRPKLVATYVDGGGVQKLAQNANLAGKVSLFVLLPGVAVSPAIGDTLIRLLSSDAFPGSGLLFFGFMLALIPFSQRQLLETIAVATERASLCTRGAAIGTLAVPLMLALLYLDAGPWAGVFALGSGHLFFAVVVVFGLAKDIGYRPDYAGVAKLGIAAIVSGSCAMFVPDGQSVVVFVVSALALSVLVFLAICWVLEPFTSAESQCLASMLPRRSSRK